MAFYWHTYEVFQHQLESRLRLAHRALGHSQALSTALKDSFNHDEKVSMDVRS
jgi:hypothetical protein